MEENTSLWNKKANDLTVGDTVKLQVLAPVLVMGGLAATGVVFSAVGSLVKKLRKSDGIAQIDTTDEQ